MIIPSDIDPAVQPLTATLLPLFRDRYQLTNEIGLPTSIHGTDLNFAPRLGIAWRPFGSNKWVARAAYGIFYVFPDSNTINNTVATVPFVAIQTTFNDRPPAIPTRTWADFFLGQPSVSPNPNRKAGLLDSLCLPAPRPTSIWRHQLPGSTYLQQWNISIQPARRGPRRSTSPMSATKTTHGNQKYHPQRSAARPGRSRRAGCFRRRIHHPVFEENGIDNAL